MRAVSPMAVGFHKYMHVNSTTPLRHIKKRRGCTTIKGDIDFMVPHSME